MEILLGIVIGVLLSQIVVVLSIYLAYRRLTPLDLVDRKLRPKAVILSKEELFKDELEKVGDKPLSEIL